MNGLYLARRAGGSSSGCLMTWLLLAGLSATAAWADPPAVVDSQSIVRSLAPSGAASASAHVATRGFSVEARPGSASPGASGPGAASGSVAGAHKIDLDIRFGNNSAELSQSAHAQLTELGRALSAPELAHARFLISGHTSATGSAEYNLRLSRSRAQTVRSYLLERFHLAPERIEATGYGSSRPLPQFPPGAIQQRRVEITTLSSGS